MRVWLDEDLCSTCGNCTDICPEVFGRTEQDQAKVVIDGEVPKQLEPEVVKASNNCPKELIFITF